MNTIGFIGGGNMAEALVKGVMAAGLFQPEQILVSDVRPERLEYLARQYAVRTASENSDVAASVDTLVLAVKPQNMPEALESIAADVRADTLVISIMAGKKVADIAAVLGELPIVRVMPNTPALIGQGASALYASAKARPLLGKAESIFAAVGKTVVVEDEGLIDAVTAVSGSGPAYYFLMMEEMIKAGTELGLTQDAAKELVLQTAKGAALLVVEADKSGESPEQLRRKVTSPGGTTEAAIKVFSEGGFGPLVSAALKRARDRSRELSG